MVSATVAMPSATLRVGNSEVHQGRMDSITVPLAVNQKAPVERRTSRKPSKQSSRRSVRCALGGPEYGLAAGVNSKISSSTVNDADAIAIGLRSRAHNSKCGNALAIGMAALAEISGDAFSACAFGHGARAVAHCENGCAIAFGFGPEAAALGSGGVAVAIADGEENAIVSAGPGGRLVIVMLSFGWNKYRSVTFEQEIDGREFRAGRRYTVDDGLWREVVDGDEIIMSHIKDFEYPASQVATGEAIQ